MGGLDYVSVVAQTQRAAAGCDFRLKYPGEQLWFIIDHLVVIAVPTVATIDHDSCGHEVGRNDPDPSLWIGIQRQ